MLKNRVWIEEKKIEERVMKNKRMIQNREESRPLKQVFFHVMDSKRKAIPCCCVHFGGIKVVSLNDDALTEILARLPAKCVARFQLVCKSWLSLISTVHRLRRLHKHQPSLILAKFNSIITNRMVAYFNFNPIIRRNGRLGMIPFSIVNYSRILSCSNGLMLLQCDNDYYVHNPTTKQSKKLSLAHNDMFIRVVSLNLVFDPSKSLHYKIVCIRAECEPLKRYQIEVFDSETGMWRACAEPFPISGEIVNVAPCVRWNNLICFILVKNVSANNFSCVCFDIVKNVSRLVACPVLKHGKAAYSHSIGESDGSLYYCALLRKGPGKSSAALWWLQENRNGPHRYEWLLKCRQKVHHLPDGLGIDLLTFIAETSTILIRVPEKIAAYNFQDRSYKELLDLEPWISSLNVHHFGHQTLVLL